MKAKIKKDEQINLVVENISTPQIEKMRILQGVIEVSEKTDQPLMPGQQELHIELQTVDQLPSIFDFLFEQKIKLVNFKREEPSLEDAFIELTKRA